MAIRALFADRLYRDPVEVTLPAGTRDIEIDFAVFAFSSPREARVRYRIEGQDAEWVEAGMRRQAFYTNLSPGTYRFELAAAGEDGPWSEEPAVLEFTIPPTFVQSGWFIGICALAIILLLGLLYRLRMASVAARIRSRLAERLGERERIARELHATLLQSVQGLVLRFQSVANRMPQGGESRAQLEDALKRADEVIAEGRSRVQELRAADGPGDLPELIRQRAVEADFDPATSVRIVVEGKQRPLHPLVSAELGRIAGEALLNVARHASANRVEVSLRYGARDLVLEIVDDGVGIAADFLDRAGRPGHFGLVGMRERAERIGAAFSIESEADGGSAVGVTLAAALAYADARPARRLPWTFKRKEKPGRA
ncbi:MAG: histidine kinase [Sphingomonas sp.]|nr:histidine kinase [Sphingomonas sp.]